MKVLIADDEPLARTRLRRLLDEIGASEIVGEAANGKEALVKAGSLHPDVVLLDIRMPEMDGLETARELARLDHPPAVIFTTAYDGHALTAFETHAVDYLVKPIRRERLQQALAACQRLNRVQIARLEQIEHTPPMRSHISANVRGTLKLVPVTEILYFHADQKYVTAHHLGGELLLEEPLKALEEEFGPCFVRIHRNALVNLAYVDAMERDPSGHCLIRLRGCDTRLEISRRHVGHVRERLKGVA